MFIFYDQNDGRLLYTMEQLPEKRTPEDPYIEVQECPAIMASWRVQNETLVLVDLGPAKEAAKARVNEIVGVARMKFITVIPGQEMIYTTKEQQARAYLAADPEPADLTDYRLLATEVAVRGITPYEAAQLILNLASIWQEVGGTLEDIRLQAMLDIDAATTEVGIEVIRDGALVQIQNLLALYAV